MKSHPFTPGATFHHWTLVKEVPSARAHRRALARCACGAVKEVNMASVRAGQSRSCGQCRRAMLGRKHGAYGTPEYKTHQAILQRCYNPKTKGWRNYGGRGITVCDRWRASFADFLADMGPRPSAAHSIGRIKNDLGYAPDNCRWETLAEQQENKRPSKWRRIVLLLAGDGAPEVLRMMSSECSDEEISSWIARTYKPEIARAA